MELTKKQKTASVIKDILAALLPLAALVLMIIITVNKRVEIYRVISIVMLIVTVVTVVLCIMVRRGKMKWWGKLLILALIWAVFYCVFAVSLWFSVARDYKFIEGEAAFAAFTEGVGDVENIYGQMDIGAADNTVYMDYTRREFFFMSNSDVLMCSYPPEEYARQKAVLNESYDFEHCVTVDGMSFGIVTVSTNDSYRIYPKCVVFIGTDDANCQIVYICNEDTERDDISSLDEFILEECGWKYIRRK